MRLLLRVVLPLKEAFCFFQLLQVSVLVPKELFVHVDTVFVFATKEDDVCTGNDAAARTTAAVHEDLWKYLILGSLQFDRAIFFINCIIAF